VEKTISQRKNKIWKGARKMNHTKEPWSDGGSSVWQNDGDMICDLSFGMLSGSTREQIMADVARIGSCVNSMAGINNPAEYIEGLKAKNKRLVKALEKIRMHEVELLQRGVGFDSEVDRIIVLALTENEKGAGQ
jgi:hypothetical protein